MTMPVAFTADTFVDGSTAITAARLNNAETALTNHNASLRRTAANASGTATLVAGTVTVANTSVTTTSEIRLSYKQVGGTPGAVFINAKTAGTSFVIKSTSATDTGVIAWEIVQF